MKFTTRPGNRTYRRATCRAPHARAANGNRLGTTVERLNDLHGRTGSLQEYLRNEEEALRWLEDAFEVRHSDAALLMDVPVTGGQVDGEQ